MALKDHFVAMEVNNIIVHVMMSSLLIIFVVPVLGPDIDTPEKEKSRLQELMSTLNIGSTHSPKRSAPCPTPAVARQTSDAGIQCDTQSATSSLSSTSTASNEIAGEQLCVNFFTRQVNVNMA